MIAERYQGGAAPPPVLRLSRSPMTAVDSRQTRQSSFGAILTDGLLSRSFGAGLSRGDIENGMVAMNQLQSDPRATAESLADCIVRIAVSRDEAAFEILFRHFAPRLKSYFSRRRIDPSGAEELVQETLVSVWKNAAQFDPSKAAASTWIFTIARNLGIDRIRKGRRPEFDPSDPALVPGEERPPDLTLERAEADQRVREVMNSLSPNEKNVLMLSFYEDHSHSEIARRLNIPIGTVKSRIWLAFEKIRSTFDTQSGV